MRFEVAVEPAPPPMPGALALELPNSGTDTLSFTRLGRIEIPFRDGERALSVFWMAGYAGGLFVPFRDTTNGDETYAAGRYLLDTAKGADLLVVGSRGHAGFAEALLGSVGQYCVHHAHCPVLIMRGESHRAAA